MPIPAPAMEIHKIRDEDVADMPVFADAAPVLWSLLNVCDLAGYSLRKFDLPLLECEFQRVPMGVPWEGAHVVDSYDLFKKMVPHTLAGAVCFYAQRSHAGATGALADVRAVAEVLAAQLERHPELPREMGALAAATLPDGAVDWLDPDGRFVRAKDGQVMVNFGNKWKGVSLNDLVRLDPGYLEWICRGSFHPAVISEARRALGKKG